MTWKMKEIVMGMEILNKNELKNVKKNRKEKKNYQIISRKDTENHI